MGVHEALSTIDASLKYLVPTEVLKTEKPYLSSVPFSKNEARTSIFTEKDYHVAVQDVRNHESEFNLSVNGFQFIDHNFENDPSEEIEGPNHPYLFEVAAHF